jgi:hypothetical protein
LPGRDWAVLWDQSACPLLFCRADRDRVRLARWSRALPKWRPVAIGAVASFAAFVLLSFFDPEPFDAPYERVEKPLPALPEMLELHWPLTFLGMIASLFAGGSPYTVVLFR